VRTVQAAAIRDVPGCRLHHCVRCRIDLAAELTLSVAAVRIVQAERIGFFGVPPPNSRCTGLQAMKGNGGLRRQASKNRRHV
jgi:hypothetical protein